MCRSARSLKWSSTSLRRYVSSSNRTGKFPSIDTIHSQVDDVDIEEFRQRAFNPELPLLISTRNTSQLEPADIRPTTCRMPAASKWFCLDALGHGNGPSSQHRRLVPSQEYLSPFRDTILPYELVVHSGQMFEQNARNGTQQQVASRGQQELGAYLSLPLDRQLSGNFYKFNAPLSLFLQACRPDCGSVHQQLYIAQAQIVDLPKQLQHDLPTPTLVKEAGKGDLYDANIWMGMPPTYTPLHKDPNPNLFLQLASSKIVRLFRPKIGAAIFRDVQQRIGQSASPSMRGIEMMVGQERDALDDSVWGYSAPLERFEVMLSTGDAIFIPRGWWHSIKSTGTDVTASVNWWFR